MGDEDLEIRVIRLEEHTAALRREIELLREELRALAHSLAEPGAPG